MCVAYRMNRRPRVSRHCASPFVQRHCCYLLLCCANRRPRAWREEAIPSNAHTSDRTTRDLHSDTARRPRVFVSPVRCELGAAAAIGHQPLLERFGLRNGSLLRVNGLVLRADGLCGGRGFGISHLSVRERRRVSTLRGGAAGGACTQVTTPLTARRGVKTTHKQSECADAEFRRSMTGVDHNRS